MNSKRVMPLALVVASYAVLVIALAMAVYATYQYFASPGRTALGLVLEHSWHVLALGVLIYITLYAVLYRTVVRPIHNIYLKIYAITKGDFSPITVDSRIMEIQEIADGVKFLLSEIDKSTPEISLPDISKVGEELRSFAKNSKTLEESAKYELMAIAAKIDEAIKVSPRRA